MNTLQTPSRTSSLNPFDIGAITQDPSAPVLRVEAAVTPNAEALDELVEFGCVDWYLYPSIRGPKRTAQPSSVSK